MRRLWICLLVAGLAGCGSKRKTATPEPPLATTQLFSFPGSCARGVASPTGQMIAALCVQDGERTKPQIYEFDLNRKTYRRVTWQDGSISSVDWLSASRLVYDSNTDELKEALFAGLTPDQVSSEIYASDRYGTVIDRWTERIGFDGDVAASRLDNSILYVTRRGSSLVVFQRRPDGSQRPVSPLTPTRKFTPAFNGGRWAWLEEDDAGRASLRIKGQDTPERWRQKNLRSLRALSQGWLVSEVNENKSGSAVWFLKADLSCEKPVWLGQEILTFADASPTPPRLALTVKNGEAQRLVLKDLDPEAFSCAEDRTPAKMME